VVIGSLTLLPAVTTDMYLPSLPDVARDLGSTPAGAQFTITGMLIGAAIGQLVIGPLSDRVGRRLPALVGIGLHLVISLLCTMVTEMPQLAARSPIGSAAGCRPWSGSACTWSSRCCAQW